ncbi:50S ribosomal protein L4 [Corynebacterium otitidis]|uniref:50S ribosomal protein L4 n=1 Tax=Corynebacterium otitidis TaxID=29321 RepID=UPI000627B261|nr:50S ribosomal protein L4 [Corynebacterium otitidis]KKO83866.1 50S ribosomal protein L4 [Corynebacterium otitidis]
MTNLKLDVHTADGNTNGQVELPSEIFEREASIELTHQVVVAQLAAARQGTGRARQGSIRAPQFTGGGIVHGPKPRDYSQRTPKKMKRAALHGALSNRAANDRIHVVEELVPGTKPSTKAARSFLERLTGRKNVLLVVQAEDLNARRSANNLPDVHILVPSQLNTYDVIKSDDVVFSKAALEAFIDRALGAVKEEK